MSLAKSVIYDNGLQRQVLPGDIVAGGENILATNATTNITVTAAMLLSGIILRSNGANGTDTLDTAANLIQAMGGGQALPNGLTFRFREIVTTAFTVTLTAPANAGIIVNRGAIAASSSKEYLVTVVNGMPAQTFSCTTTNASAILGGLTAAQCALLSPGMIVTNAVAGLQGTTILGVNIAAGTVTMSGNANATNGAPGVAVSFSPVIQFDGLVQGGI